MDLMMKKYINRNYEIRLENRDTFFADYPEFTSGVGRNKVTDVNKNKKEEILQPVFTDVMELEKFTKGQKLRIAKVPFAKLPELLIDKAMAYAVNPLGFNLVLNREQLNKIIGLK